MYNQNHLSTPAQTNPCTAHSSAHISDKAVLTIEPTIMQYKNIIQTEEAIDLVKYTFSKALMQNLHLHRVSSPISILDGTGINDDLNGIERPVKFPVKALQDKKAVIVQSLAKWKRIRLKELNVPVGKGILTDMRALRPDEDFSSIHSIYVDQWDWELNLAPENRTLEFLKQTVRNIYRALLQTEQVVHNHYPQLNPVLPKEITFIHAETLLKKFPSLTPKQRENEAARLFGAVFIIGIGENLSHGEPHDGRAPDYDDWSSENEEGFKGLNGDIILWNPVLACAFEVSSMGIRVDPQTLQSQLAKRKCEERKKLNYHSLLLSGQLPQSIGGGVGQSRVCMFMLRKKHVGEVQVGIWPEGEKEKLEKDGIYLL